MHPNKFMDRLRGGETLLGLAHMYPAAGIVEGMSPGWDFIWVDAQHGEMSYDAVLRSLWACAAAGVESLLRVPGHEPGIVAPLADLSPSAVMVPMVNTAEEARQVVSMLRFPPQGTRSYGGRRLIDLYGREGYRTRELGIVVQIETPRAVENAAAIAAVEGVDALFFGPDDMKAGLGLPINAVVTETPVLRDAMRKTADAARAAGKFLGCVAVNPTAVTMSREMGYQIMVGGGDSALLNPASQARLKELRGALAGAETPAPSGAAKSDSLYGR